ncbi:hypothetical protein H8D04_00320 [bacterium]|nr:hypothetical protein [bacterium]
MNRWSGYDKYIVMTDRVVGTRQTYPAFLEFRRVKNALTQISKDDSGIYLYDGDTYKRPITQSRAAHILEKIELCKWDDDIRTVAKQIGAHEMLSPR